MIRILRIIARLNVGGPAIQAISLSEHFTKGIYETRLVCGRVAPHEGDMSYLAKRRGVQPVIIPELGREMSPLSDLKSLLALSKIVRQFRPHIIHTHTAKAGTLGRLAGINSNLSRDIRNRTKLVHTFHGHIFHSYFGLLKTFFFIRIERFLSTFTDKVVVISPLLKEDVCRRFKIAPQEKAKIIPLGFDLSDFSDCDQNKRKETRKRFLPYDSRDTVVVGIIGRLTHVKNHSMLLRAVKALKDRGKSELFRFLVVGDGELREDLIKYARDLGIQNSVIFTGWQKDMPSIYGAMDVVVLTSLNEGTPVTLIEAMANAIPVVATDVGGVRDLMGMIDEKSINSYKLAQNGILVRSGDADTLAKALLFLSENREVSERVARRAKEFVLKQHTLDRLVKDIESLYTELLAK